MKKFKKGFLIILLMFSVILFSSCDISEILDMLNEFSTEESDEVLQSGNVEVHFIDVGQGDATFILSDYGNVLIDGGESQTEDFLVEYIKDLGVSKIDLVIATHPHSDHIGGLDKIIDSFIIESVYMPKVTHTTSTYEKLLKSILNKNLKATNPKAGSTLKMGEIEFHFLNPIQETYNNLNNYSIVTKMVFGDISFLFTGDAEKEVENDILNKGYDIKADVYKVSHHGSSTSSSEEFVRAVSPSVGIISCGKNNDYGHPHRETMALLKKMNLKIYRTDEMGSIVLATNGTELFLNNSEINLLSEASLDDDLSIEYVGKNGEGLIKGNINRKGDKIYHMPGGAYYNDTVAEMYFKTEKEAVENGFRKSSK